MQQLTLRLPTPILPTLSQKGAIHLLFKKITFVHQSCHGDILNSRSASDKYTRITEKIGSIMEAHSKVQLTAPYLPVSFQSLLPTNEKLQVPILPVNNEATRPTTNIHEP